jgi:hypothetical protein
MASPYDMSTKECEDLLASGGHFEAAGGILEVHAIELGGKVRYVLLNESGNGGEYIQERFSTVQDLMEQMTPLSEWTAIEASPG